MVRQCLRKTAYGGMLGPSRESADAMAFEPFDAAKTCIRRSRRLLRTCATNLADPKVKNDLRRAALMMAVAGLDSYLHWLVYRRVSEVRVQGELPKSFRKLEIPFFEVSSLVQSLVASRRKGVATRPWVKAKRLLQRRLLQETFQSYDEVSNALALAGIKSPWKCIAAGMSSTPDTIKNRLSSIVYRRNQIVHEGDIARASRPRRLKYNELTHESIKADIEWIRDLVETIDDVVDRQMSAAKVSPRGGSDAHAADEADGTTAGTS